MPVFDMAVPSHRGAKSGGTRELGSQKVNQSAESCCGQQEKLLKPKLQMFLQKILCLCRQSFNINCSCSHDVSADNDSIINH